MAKPSMDIKSEHHVDAGERGRDGYYDYHYAYTEFVVTLDSLRAGFRLYDNERAIYARWIEVQGEQKIVKWGPSYGAVTFPRESQAMKSVLKWFQTHHDVQAVKAYDGPIGAYSEVAIDELV